MKVKQDKRSAGGVEFLTYGDFVKRIEEDFEEDQTHFTQSDFGDSQIGILQSLPTKIKSMDGEGEILFTISTPNIDRDGDTISVKGWDLKAYKKNPVVLWAHNYDMPPVGRALKTFKEGDVLKSHALFTPEEISPFGYMIYQMIKNKFLNTTSVGFKPTDFEFVTEEDKSGNIIRRGIDFKKQELLEYSVVPVPANAEALVEARSVGINTVPLKAWAESVLDDWDYQSDKTGLLVPKDKIEEIRKFADPKSGTQVWFDSLDAKGVHASNESEDEDEDDSKQITYKYTCACEGHQHDKEEDATECIKNALDIIAEYGVELEGLGKDTFYSVNVPGQKLKLILRAEFINNLTSKGIGSKLENGSYKFDKAVTDKIKELMNSAVEDKKETKDLVTEDYSDWEKLIKTMGALLGVFGGTEESIADKKKQYDLLSSHYRKDFNKEPPEFRYVKAQVLANLSDLFFFDEKEGVLVLLTKSSLSGKEGSMNIKKLFTISEGLVTLLKEEDVEEGLTKFTSSKLYSATVRHGEKEDTKSFVTAHSLGECNTEEEAKEKCSSMSDSILAKAVGTLKSGVLVYELMEEDTTKETNKKDDTKTESGKIDFERLEDVLDGFKKVLAKIEEMGKSSSDETEVTEEELKTLLAGAQDTVKNLIANVGRVD